MNEVLENRNGNACATTESSRPSVWFTPRFDMYETDNEFVLLGDLPGVEPQELDVKFENQELTIHGRVPARRTRGCSFLAERMEDCRRNFRTG